MKTFYLSLALSLMFFSGILCQEEPSPTDDYVDPLQFVKEQRDKDEEFRRLETQTEYPNGVNVIPGEAETDYPILAKVERSAFSCIGRPVGFYADPELRCQVWHICDEGQRQQSFLCTNGTIYNQAKRVCDWWYNVNCDPNVVNHYYERNKELYTDEEVHYVRNKEAAQKGSEQFITKPTPTKSSSELLFLQHSQREHNRKAQEGIERNSNQQQERNNEPNRNYQREEERRNPSATPTTIIISRGSAPPIIVRGPQGPPPERKPENQNQQQRRRPEPENQNRNSEEQLRAQQSNNRPVPPQDNRQQQGNQARQVPDNFRNQQQQQNGQFRPQQQQEGFRPSPEENRSQQHENFRPVQPQQQSSQQRPEIVRPPQHQQQQQRPENQRPPQQQQQQRPENQRPPQQQQQQRPENQRPPQHQQQQQRPENQRPPQQQPQQRPENQRPPQQQQRPDGLRSQENLRPQQQNEPQRPKSPPPPQKAPKINPSFDSNIVHVSKFRHSTPRKHNVKFAASSRSFDDDDNKERQVPEESQHPRYTYNINDFYKPTRVQAPAPTRTTSAYFPPPDYKIEEQKSAETNNEEQSRNRVVVTPVADGPTSQTIPIIPEQRKQRVRPDVIRLQLSSGIGGPQFEERQFQPQSPPVPNPIYDSAEQQQQPQRTRPTPPVVILVTKPAPTLDNKKIQLTHKFVVVKAKPTPEPAEWSGKEIILNKNSEPVGTRVIKERIPQKKVTYVTTTQAPVSTKTYAPFAENSEEEELIRQQFLEGSFEYGVKKSAYRRSSS